MTHMVAAAALVAVIPTFACSVSVDEDAAHNRADVQISTMLGNLSVRTGGKLPETGLAVYPGAWPRASSREPESADVSVGNALFGVKVAAANFESPDAPQEVVRYYRDVMREYGDVTECRGNIDFRSRKGQRVPVCRGRSYSRTTQLVVGTEAQHRVVSVKRRGSGSEFSLVYVTTLGEI